MSEDLSKVITKTGTLTLGLVCSDGIVLAADRRMSYAGQGGVSYLAGSTKKIIELNPRIISTMAGTASDALKTLQIARAEIRLKELKTKEETSVPEAANLLANMTYRGIRTPSMIPSIAHFIIAGYDQEDTYLFDITPDGIVQREEGYVASGAGIMQAHPILDTEYKKGISVEQGTKLAVKCIRASMGRDPSVGEGINLYVIKKGEIKEILDQKAILDFK